MPDKQIQPIKYVINTHYHLDHAFGNSEFAKLGARSSDIKYIHSELVKSFPSRDGGDWIVEANIRMRYLKKQ